MCGNGSVNTAQEAESAVEGNLGCGIGLGLVSPDAAEIATELTIRHEKVSMPATVCELPFYEGGSVRA